MPDSQSIRLLPAGFVNEWNIQGRASACQSCGKPFADRQPYHTLLFDARNAYRRLDICSPCWEARQKAGDYETPEFISHWQGVYEVPPAPAEPIRKDTAESLLRKLTARNEPRYAAAAFILAVMLERKRVLKVKEQLSGHSGRVWVYEHPKSGDVFSIPDPGLRMDELETVQRDVAELLEKGLPEPATAESAVAAQGPADQAASPDGPVTVDAGESARAVAEAGQVVAETADAAALQGAGALRTA